MGHGYVLVSRHHSDRVASVARLVAVNFRMELMPITFTGRMLHRDGLGLEEVSAGADLPDQGFDPNIRR